jgi:hypothetical protein
MKPKPIFDETPNTDGVATMDEEVVCHLSGPLAKQANTTIWPSSLGKPFGHQNTILEGKPSEELNFRRDPNLPY